MLFTSFYYKERPVRLIAYTILINYFCLNIDVS
nr:MAG TPA: hypothetical protein [Bacteriophage sp.]